MTRDEKFGRVLAIADVLGERTLPANKASISSRYSGDFARHPEKVLKWIHEELIAYNHNWGDREMLLFEYLADEIAGLETDEFNNTPLSGKYLQAVMSKRAELNNLISADQAAKKWDMHPSTVKNYCAKGKIISTKIGKTWVIDGMQPNPKGIVDEEDE
ncbi:helix-turn-helix domain-containing protein [Aureibacillus halotolerans]|uniref:CRISPR-associated protein Csd1 family n=1 Tax=Aureibacillus halotolerans TaxID=1508390 RepID=A0A4R6U014_9BACI|nr:helix-turn-helix domain-containing protein [Aureibacillus halotolerans]TDQ39251.1 CRISPR-associated protein Csd1 family [Aureibacillus halotolerans]